MHFLSLAIRLSSDPRSLYLMPNHLLRRHLPSTFRVASTGGVALWLAGCAASPPQSQSPPPAQPSISAPLKTIMMTVDEIQTAERRAYSDGFAAGEDYERQHCTVKPAPNTSTPPAPDLSNIKASGGGTANTGATNTSTANTGASDADEQGGKTPAPSATAPKPDKSNPGTGAVLQSLPPFASIYSTSGPAQKLSP